MRGKAGQVLGGVLAAFPASSTRTSTLSVDVPQIQVEVEPRQGGAVRPQAGRRAPGSRRDRGRPGDRATSSRTTRSTASSCGACRRRARTRRRSALSCSTRRPVGQVRLGEVATVRLRSDPYLVTRENGSRYIDVAPTCRGATCRRWYDDQQRRLKGVRFAQGSHYQLLGEYAERQAAQQQPVHHRDHRPRRDLPAAAALVRLLARWPCSSS